MNLRLGGWVRPAIFRKSIGPGMYIVHPFHLHGRTPLHLWGGAAEGMQWLEVFHPLTAVKNLYVSRIFTRRIALALQDLVGERLERVTEVLPTLKSLFLEDLHPSGPVKEAVGRWAVRCCTTALWSPCSRFSLEKRNVIILISSVLHIQSLRFLVSPAYATWSGWTHPNPATA
jgi:hypothetical protein